MNIEEIQSELRNQKLDGWLFFDHHQRDALAYRVLGLIVPRTPTRCWYYLMPAKGEPVGLVHNVEPGMLDSLPGKKTRYSTWQEQISGLRILLDGRRRIAMQYSPECAIPLVSMVDAGTVELVRGLGVEVLSSADLIQHFEARWSADALASHLEAGQKVDSIRRQAFEMIGARLRGGQQVSEYESQQFIRTAFEAARLVTDHGPIVGVNANAANPHYQPPAQGRAAIRHGRFAVIDMWAKLNRPGAAYYDITRTRVRGGPPAPALHDLVSDLL